MAISITFFSSTLVQLIGFGLAALAILEAPDVSTTFTWPAWIIFIAMASGIIIEAGSGLRNLIRVDLLMLFTLYLLTFFEFLFPQPEIEDLLVKESAEDAALLVVLAFTGLLIGRHTIRFRGIKTGGDLSFDPQQNFAILLFCFFFGFLHVFLAVNFDLVEAVRQMAQPRFTQSWTRARYGDLSALLNEIGLLIYLVPPLGGLILARWRSVSMFVTICTFLILVWTFYFGFSNGTRNVFLVYILTFSIALISMKKKLNMRSVVPLMVPVLTLVYFSIVYLPEIRTVGLNKFDLNNSETKDVFVDQNLLVIALLTERFPDINDYLGMEIFAVTVTMPVPRALWPGKPRGLSVGIEEALGVSDRTLAATYIGELYMAGGGVLILLASIGFGATASVWNRRGARSTNLLQFLTYLSGFGAAAVLMRSMISVVPLMLPTLALIFYQKFARIR